MLTTERIAMSAEQWEFDPEDEKSESDGSENDEELDWSSDEEGGVDDAAMKKTSSKVVKSKIDELRKKFEKDRVRELKKMEKDVKLKETKTEKIRRKEREMRDTRDVAVGKKKKKFTKSRIVPGDWKLKNMETETAEEGLLQNWDFGGKAFRVKTKGGLAKSKFSRPKYLDFTSGREDVNVKNIKETKWDYLEFDQRASIISATLFNKGSVSTISPDDFVKLHDYFFEHIAGSDEFVDTVGDILLAWYSRMSMFTSSLAPSLGSISHWVKNGWLSPDDFFRIPLSVAIPEFYLSKKFLQLDEKDSEDIIESLHSYIVEYSTILSTNLITIALANDPTKKLKTLDVPLLPKMIFDKLSNMSENCSLDIPMERLVGYVGEDKIAHCGDIFTFKREMPEDAPEEFQNLVENLTPIHPDLVDFKFDDEVTEKVEEARNVEIVFEAPVESESYKILLNLLMQNTKKVAERREKCNECKKLMKSGQWITGDYIEGQGSLLKFCSKKCFDKSTIKIYSDIKPVEKVRERQLSADMQASELEEEFENYFEAVVDSEFAKKSDAKKKDWLKKSISIGERAVEQAMQTYGPSSPEALRINAKVDTLKDVQSGKMSIADSLVKNEQKIKRASIEKELAKIQKYKVSELKDWLRDRELSPEGKRQELLDRAIAHIEGVKRKTEVEVDVFEVEEKSESGDELERELRKEIDEQDVNSEDEGDGGYGSDPDFEDIEDADLL